MTVTKNSRVYGTRLGLTINGKDYWSDMAKYELAPEDSDKNTVTFADAASGNTSQWVLKGEAIVSFDTGSFWDFVWQNAGKTLNFILAPFGNKTAAATKPHFTGQVTIGSKPGVSSEAGDDKGALFSFEWKIVGEPAKVIQTSTLGTGNMEDA